MAAKPDRYRAPLTVDQRRRLRDLVETRGEQAVADALHTTRYTLGRGMGGLNLRESTRTLIATRLDEVAGE